MCIIVEIFFITLLKWRIKNVRLCSECETSQFIELKKKKKRKEAAIAIYVNRIKRNCETADKCSVSLHVI